jgi:hypothetical protein
MNDTNLRWAITRSLFIAAAGGVPALAQELPPPVVSGPFYDLPTPAQVVPLLPAVAPPMVAPPEAALGSPQANGWRDRWLRTYRERIWGFPEESEDAPLGRSLGTHMSTQIANGQSARMALYQYDFVPLSTELKPRGKAGLQRIAAWSLCNSSPIYLEPTPGRPDLDEARRKVVSWELANGPQPIPSERIVIGRPSPHGLSGAEALLIDRNLMQQTTARGTMSGGGSGAQGGAATSASGTSSSGAGAANSTGGTSQGD